MDLVCPSSVFTSEPVFAFHFFTVLSLEAVKSA
jgi:hypothetical protein